MNIFEKRGIALYLIVSALLSVVILSSTFILGSNKMKSNFVPAINKIQADYYLESSILMAFNQACVAASKTEDLKLDFATREISPGLILKMKEIPTKPSEKRVLATIEGEGITRELEAVLISGGASGSMYINADWSVKFLPDFSGE
ncbi:MAG: hypothetical protein HQM08_03870 [Candidatus Riflebacteria bacterium]|nr:hypothetical protein [Candidatus Riflebacteria bacterium]